ncbi:hypothetical protein HYC85_006726 [Camellia sinensis]|uniref:phosphatidate phosphatase n=1 Tax=Camellia sinensis TaxID=4442 RepID=A0A7J7HLW4_CAMSI|nr:hypothetical protein HYC85_006726 [Camellia sinensis]
MNVVGRVGSFISQGVYSVATPFHPFGGAVDIIVVQQQDGTFRSAPWYVRFGKFQGVLKGAEKIVRISVNGVEANFNMHLDNSGEAYFVREVVSGEGSNASAVLNDSDSLVVTRQDSSISDNNNVISQRNNGNLREQEGGVSNGEVQLQDEHVALGVDLSEMTESDSERRFYEFPDDQSSLDDSGELSEYGSNRYDNLDSVEHFVESQNLNAEVVLVSIDGHILTAPISSSETNTDILQLSTPQFHLGPGQEADFVEGNADFSPGEETWAADYLGDLGTSAPEVASENSCSVSNAGNAVGQQMEVCDGDGEHLCHVQEVENVAHQEQELCVNGNLEAASTGIRGGDIFKSCLELTTLATRDGNVNQQDVDSPLEIHDNTDNSQEKSSCTANETGDGDVGESRNRELEKSPCNLLSANETGDGDVGESRNRELEKSPCNLRSANETGDGEVGESRNSGELTPSSSGAFDSVMGPDLKVEVELIEDKASSDHMDSDNSPVDSVSHNEELEEQVDNTLAVEGIQCSPQGSAPEDECSKSEIVEPQTVTSGDEIKTDSRLEISLCGNLLHAGMGLNAAAEVFDAHRISEEAFKLSAASITKNENLVVRFHDRYLPWDKAAHVVLGVAAYGSDLPVEAKDAILVEQDETPKAGDDGSGITSTPSGRRWRLWPNPFRRVKTLEHTTSNASSEEVFVDSESGSQNFPPVQTPTSSSGGESPHKQLLRTNVPTTEQIASLKLKEGQNMVTFSFSTRVLGMQQVDAHIYLWKWNARIVISDVDGTITKSDVLGQFMPLVGKDWTQSGVARLFSAIKDGKALPNGPVVISPDGLFPSLYREVIRRAPHEFKIACLEDIKALFPTDYNPFYAGFGNRDTDELSYRKIGIPKGKIFIINPKGEVAISHRIDVKSYTSLHTLVNDMFPPTSMVEQEDFNSWNYWKMPIADLE